MTRYFGTVATNTPDQDGEQFADEALAQIAQWAPGMPIAQNFDGVTIGHVVSAALFADSVEVEADGALAADWYIVPQVAFDPKDCTEENGVKVFHRVKLMGFGLTRDPSDRRLEPLKAK